MILETPKAQVAMIFAETLYWDVRGT